MSKDESEMVVQLSTQTPTSAIALQKATKMLSGKSLVSGGSSNDLSQSTIIFWSDELRHHLSQRQCPGQILSWAPLHHV
jgi:hypothetical protein